MGVARRAETSTMSNSALVVGTVDDADGESKRPGDAGDLPGQRVDELPDERRRVQWRQPHLVGWGTVVGHRTDDDVEQRRPGAPAGGLGRRGFGLARRGFGLGRRHSREIENPPRAARPAYRAGGSLLVIDLVSNRPRHVAGVEPSRRRESHLR